MAAISGDQGQDLCRILVLAPENTDIGASHSFNSSPLDIEKGASGFPKIDRKTAGSIKIEIPSTMKLLRRQNSLQKGGEFISPLMNHILMLLKFDPKEKQALERVHDAATNRWRKYKRVASFDSRQIVKYGDNGVDLSDLESSIKSVIGYVHGQGM